MINNYGNDKYGILSLALATNTYMLLLDLGVNTGAIKYFSQWIHEKNIVLISRVARTSITFYGLIGLLNSAILLFIAFWGEKWFQLDSVGFNQLKISLILLACFSVINWSGSILNQLLIASEKMVLSQKMYMLNCATDFISVALAIKFNITINEYFFLFQSGRAAVMLVTAFVCYKEDILKNFMPGFYWADFSIVLKYSVVIFIMSLFQATATKSRPILIGIFDPNAARSLTDYRIMEVFSQFVIAIGGTLVGILLPRAAKFLSQNDRGSIERLAYTGTVYTSILSLLLIMPIVICSKEILFIYMGISFVHLHYWLAAWCLIILMYLHNSPVSSLVLASGQTMQIAKSSALGCIISMFITGFLSVKLGAGATVVGYGVYILIQQINYYVFYNKQVLGLNSARVFLAFFKPTMLALICAGMVIAFPWASQPQKGPAILLILLKSVCWVLAFILALIGTKTIDYQLLTTIISSSREKSST